MALMCSRHNLGTRVRSVHLRSGVLMLGATLGLGYALLELGLGASAGWLLLLPLTIGTYSLLAGLFGVCIFAGLYGKRHADHGLEAVADARQRRRLLRRGMALVAFSGGIAALATTAFVVSV